MKKNGFTVAELLISMGIVGVIAALTLPLVGRITPDANKVMYLKAYDALNETVSTLASDSTVFNKILQVNSEIKLDIKKYPLLDTTASQNRNFRHHAGKSKLCKLLAESFGAQSDSCSDSDYTFTDADFNDKFNRNISFTSNNGVSWWVVPKQNEVLSSASGTHLMLYQTDVYVDVNNSSSSKNCIYNASRCKNPDRFKFMISAEGAVIPADPVGEFYATHRQRLTKKIGEAISESANNTIVNKLDNSIYRASVPVYEKTQKSKNWKDGKYGDIGVKEETIDAKEEIKMNS